MGGGWCHRCQLVEGNKRGRGRLTLSKEGILTIIIRDGGLKTDKILT